MSDNPAPICTGCGDESGTHTHPSVAGVYCGHCADVWLPIAEPEDDDPIMPCGHPASAFIAPTYRNIP